MKLGEPRQRIGSRRVEEERKIVAEAILRWTTTMNEKGEFLESSAVRV